MTNKQEKKHYIDNVKFSEEAAKYVEEYNYAKDNGLVKPKLNEYLGKCILLLANKVSNMPSFNSYSYKDEMVSEAIEIAVRYFHNYRNDVISKRTGKPTAGAHTYFTTIMANRMYKCRADHKLQMFIKEKYISESSDLFVEIQSQDEKEYSESLKEILDEMSGCQYLEYDLKLAEKKEEQKKIQNKSPKKVKEKIELPLDEFF